MKIFVVVSAPDSDVIGNINSSTVPVDIEWYFDDGVTSGEVHGAAIPWSALSTATVLNAAIKSAATASILNVAGYTVNLLTDQIFYVGGFIGL